MERADQLIGELPGESAGLLPSSHYTIGLHQIAVGFHDAGGGRYVLVHVRLFQIFFAGLQFPFPPEILPTSLPAILLSPEGPSRV